MCATPRRDRLTGLARKNGKSSLSAGIALDWLMSGRPAPRFTPARVIGTRRGLCSAPRDAWSSWSPRWGSAETVPDVIEHPEIGSVYKVLSAEAYSKEGLNPNLVLFDEVHVQPNRELWDVMSLAAGARPEPLMVGITTAGARYDTSGQDSLCYQLYEYGQRITSGEVDDPSFFFAWWEPRDPDADHHDPKTWRQANPGFEDLVSVEDFATTVLRTPSRSSG